MARPIGPRPASDSAAGSYQTLDSIGSSVNETKSEIITATDDGMTLIYSDSPAGGIGFVDITDAKTPKQAGFLDIGAELVERHEAVAERLGARGKRCAHGAASAR